MSLLERAATTVAIQQVLYRYCRSMDRMDADLALSCFEPDAELNYSGLFRGSPAEFVAWLWPIHAAMVGHSHQVANVLVDVGGDGASAVSESYVTVVLRSATPAGDLVDLTGRGRYLDTWRCEGDVWRITARTYVSDLSVVSAVVPTAYPVAMTPVEGAPRLVSARDRSDPSYTLSGWPGAPT